MDTSSVKYRELIDEILDITSQSVSLIQEICFDLIPAAFEKSSLNAVIDELITRSKISGVDFIFSSNHAEIVFENKKYTLFIYRIIQEFVNNSLKYAHAETIYIIIKYVKKTGEFEMNLVDDGIGFDMNITVFNNGIYNMQQRLNSLKANYEFVSEPGKGTKLKFQLNLKNDFKNQSLID
jgi:signal transduction histidine kinase